MAASDSDGGFTHQGEIAFRVSVAHHPAMALVFESLAWPSLSRRSSLQLPYPNAGYGGSAVSISPRARYAAAMLYSGQSEVGYELFALNPAIQRLAGIHYFPGECDLTAPTFSPDERFVALAVEHRSWWLNDDAPSDDPDADCDTARGGITTWSTLFVHELGRHSPTEVAMVVDLPKGWFPEAGTWPRRLRFSGPTTLTLGVPWLAADFSFDLPPNQSRIIVPSPTTKS
jgi:hypothetical protein